MTTESAKSAQTIAAMGKAETWGQTVKRLTNRYASAVAAFVGAVGWGLAQLTQGWDTFKGWYAQMGLWPVIALATLGVLALHGARTQQLLTAISAAITALTEQDGKLIEQDRKHDEAIDELRAEVGQIRKRLDHTGPHVLEVLSVEDPSGRSRR